MKDDPGATAVEHGLIAAPISVAAITAFTTMGTRRSGLMLDSVNKLK